MKKKINVTVWNEFIHEQDGICREIYPQGIHTAIGECLLKEGSFNVNYAWLEKDEEHGLSLELLENTDVLFWWGHIAHDRVKDEIVDRLHRRVQQGMGLIALHSGRSAKIMRRLLGTGCEAKWREMDEKEQTWTIEPDHPIAAGLPEYFELPETEMYGEHFNIPAPKDIVFISWYEGGEVLRSGVTFERGAGKIFYFSPGHESLPIYYDENIQKVLINSAKWAAPEFTVRMTYGNAKPLEEIKR